MDDYARNLYLRRMNIASTPDLNVRFEIIPAEVECKENRLRGGVECELVRELPLTDKLNDGNVQAAPSRLQAFVGQVNAFIAAGVLAPEDGQPLIDQATAVIDFLSGG